jgi:hypothetical protein
MVYSAANTYIRHFELLSYRVQAADCQLKETLEKKARPKKAVGDEGARGRLKNAND